jgi:hypothetical protein
LHQTVSLLQRSIENVRDGFLSRGMLDDVEEKNYRSIINLVNKCENDLERLQIILPKPPDKDGTFVGLRAQFARKLCEDTVKDIIMGIKLCNSVSDIGEQSKIPSQPNE